MGGRRGLLSRDRRRAQISIEYVLIVAFTFAVLIPGIYFFYTYSQGTTASLSSAQYTRLGQEMVSTAVKVRAQGEGAWITLDLLIPDGVEAINVSHYPSETLSEIVIRHRTAYGPSETVFFTEVPLSNSSLERNDGSVFLSGPHGGKATLRFTAIVDGAVAVEERYG